jgi:hypothetical protein
VVSLEHAHEMQFICVGSASTALAGLLFVALSLHLSPIVGNPVWRARALGSLGALFGVLLTSIFILIPGQPRGHSGRSCSSGAALS